MNQFILTTMAFGRASEYKRAILAILSAYAHLSIAKESLLVVFYTDNPPYFSNWFEGLNVQIVELDKAKIKTLRGKLDFVHNIKIGIIDETFTKFPDNSILYIDADTFFIADPIIAFNRINLATSCMYAHEYQFKELGNTGFHSFDLFHHLLSSQFDFFLANKDIIKVGLEDSSWNAGVIGIHSRMKNYIPDVYSLTDQFYPPTHNHCSEQYAFSIILNKNSNLMATDDIIQHYYHRVKKPIIDEAIQNFLPFKNAALMEKFKQVQSISQKYNTLFSDRANFLDYMDKSFISLSNKKLLQGYKWFFLAFLNSPMEALKRAKDVLYLSKQLFYK